MKLSKVILFSVIAVLLLVISELVFIVNNPGTRETYTVVVVRQLAAARRYEMAFRILTDGKFNLPQAEPFREDAKKILDNMPADYLMSHALYDMAILAYQNKIEPLTEELLKLAVKHDPNLSYWAVELSNYYLLKNDLKSAESVLNMCMQYRQPAEHCSDFMEENVKTNAPQQVGFLQGPIKVYYESGYR